MLYWLTGTGASAAREYWENGQAADRAAGRAPLHVSVPVGFTVFRIGAGADEPFHQAIIGAPPLAGIRRFPSRLVRQRQSRCGMTLGGYPQ